jgi:hypothetical protein
MDKLIIGIIFSIIILIILFIYFQNKKKYTDTATTNNITTNGVTTNNITINGVTTNNAIAIAKSSLFLDKILSAFNIRIDNIFSDENLGTTSVTNPAEIVFITEDDIKNNIMVFLEYLYPKMNVDEINALLKTYNSNKTMQQILNDNNNKIDIQSINNIFQYEGRLYDETDDKIIANNIRAYRLIINSSKNINLIKEILSKHNSTLPTNSHIKYVNLVVSNDFKTNNIISLYYKTNYNENLKIIGNEEINFGGSNSIQCLTSKLCQLDFQIYIKNEIKLLKEWAIKNKDKIKNLFNLSMVGYLLELNDNITNILDDINKLENEVYRTKPMLID